MSNNKQASKNALNQMTRLARTPSNVPSKAADYAAGKINAKDIGRDAAGRIGAVRREARMQETIARSVGKRGGKYHKREAAKALNEKTAMDTQLAAAVFGRWNEGLPVAETTLYKAASALGIDPDDALLEARYYTMLDHDLAKVASGHVLTPTDLNFYSLAAGHGYDGMAKTASTYGMHPQDLVLAKLAEANWVPNLEGIKLAMMMGQEAMGPEAGMAPPPGAPPEAAAPPPGEMPPPQEGQAVQQAPEQRFKPSPMAPAQVPPSPSGNLHELAQSAMNPQADQAPAGAMGEQGVPQGGDAGMGPAEGESPPPMDPQTKIQQVSPDLPPETVQRYAEKLQEVEQEAGIPIEDPGQMQKFLQGMQKEDSKKIDEAIKNMAEPTPLRAPKPAAQPAQQAQAPAEDPAQEKVAASAFKGLKAFGRRAKDAVEDIVDPTDLSGDPRGYAAVGAAGGLGAGVVAGRASKKNKEKVAAPSFKGVKAFVDSVKADGKHFASRMSDKAGKIYDGPVVDAGNTVHDAVRNTLIDPKRRTALAVGTAGGLGTGYAIGKPSKKDKNKEKVAQVARKLARASFPR